MNWNLKTNRDLDNSLRYYGWLPATDGEQPMEQKRLMKTVTFKQLRDCQRYRLQGTHPVLWMGSTALMLLSTARSFSGKFAYLLNPLMTGVH